MSVQKRPDGSGMVTSSSISALPFRPRRIAVGMVVVIVAAVIAVCLLVTWSLCHAAALGDEIAENLRKKAGHEGE